MDFFQIRVKEKNEKQGGGLIAYPDFIVGRSNDLMVRAKNFYAIWDEEKGLWSTDEYDVQRLVDDKLHAYRKENRDVVEVKLMKSFASNGQSTFRKYMSQIGDNAHQLDETLTFLGTRVGKKDYVSKRLPYDLSPGDISSWSELTGTLYDQENRAKIEWAIGSIVSGESKTNQKFVVLYGPPGAGKGTIINIVLKLFNGYVTTFDAKALGTNGNQFAAAAFSGNPLVAIQHDGDLSRIEDNTTLNSIVSHEIMKINEKFRPSYDSRINAFLMMGTNKPVKITDAQSGLIRRLIDVHPTGTKLPPKKYHELMAKIEFELGAIAHHCLAVYKKMGKNYYSNYQPLQMMFQTDVFFNYIETYYDLFSEQDGVSAKQAWNLYKEYCEDANITKDRSLQLHKFKAELGNYFDKFQERVSIDGVLVRSYYSGFKARPFMTPVDDDATTFVLRLEATTSLLNLELAEYPAQYSKADGSPAKYWDDSVRDIRGVLKRPRPDQIVSTLLGDLDTTKEHYVKLPENHIVIDFDLEGDDGKKSLGRCLEEAAKWPATYAELSRSGNGVHLHYYYEGDVERLDQNYSPGIEVKRYSGNSALRRRLTRCNDVPIATISSGLPLKEKKRVLDEGSFKSEKGLREFIAKNLRKEYHPGTKSSVDFIKKGLDDAYEDGLSFDVSDLKQKVMVFANNSTNQPLNALKVVTQMRWKSEEDIPIVEPAVPTETRRVFYDVEIFPNLFVVCWKFEENNPSVDNVVCLINPPPHVIEALMRLRLVGFNNKKYDNPIMWAAAMGFNNLQLYQLSKKIIDNVPGSIPPQSKKISYADVYDYSTDKMGLKKWQIKLGLKHRELDLPWDEPVPEDRIQEVAEYCANDVVSLEHVAKHLDGDWAARLILADLSGLPPNEGTAKHTTTIVFGKEKNPQSHFVYTDLSKEFPGYAFDPYAKADQKSTYRGEFVGEGGLVRGKPGLYRDVALLDVSSMHPTTIGHLNLFGEYTPRYMAIVEAQLALKRRDYATAKGLLDGKLRPYIERIEKLKETDPAEAEKARAALRHGLKIAMNIVYGLTSAKFDNAFKHAINVDNIVAKRGALFMIDLMYFIEEELGLMVVHIKTDSVKVPGANADHIQRIQNFAKKYGYDMELEAMYAKFGLVNDAVYVAKKDQCINGEWVAVDEESDVKHYQHFLDDEGCPVQCWSATGSQYQHPYVFKKLFGYHDDISFHDVCETKNVQAGDIRLDFGFHYAGEDGPADRMGYMIYAMDLEKAAEKARKKFEKTNSPEDHAAYDEACDLASKAHIEAMNQLVFVGRTGQFTPVREGYGGGQLWRMKDGRPYAIAGTKGHLWVDSNIAADLPDEAIDYDFFDNLVEEARKNLEKFLDGSEFASVDEFIS